MKVLFVANSSWYLQNFRSSTINVFSEQYDTVSCSPKGCNSSCLESLKGEARYFYLDAGGKNPFNELLGFFSLLRLIAKEKPEVVYSFNPKTNLYALIACSLLGRHCVPNVSGVGVASQLNGLAGKLYRGLSSFFYKRASHVFFQNSDDYQSFLAAGWISVSKSEVLPGSGVNLDAFYPSHKEEGKFFFLMASRLIKQKGVEEYLKAARQVLKNHTNCEFFIAGVEDKSSRSIDKSLIDDLKHDEKIHFLGHVTDMPDLLNKVDCVVLPSYYPEGTPRSLIEACASGKIIITTNTPGCRDVVANNNGLLINPRSVSELVKSFESIMQMPSNKIHEMKKSSRHLAEEKFDENIVISRYLDVVRKLTT